MPTTDLLAYLLESQRHPFTKPLTHWLASKRFRVWDEANRDKIRKKIRGTRDADTTRDLFFELHTAYLLVQERRFAVTYEHFGAEKVRGPDFTVTFGSLTFHVEVTRLRPADQPAPTLDHEAARLTDTVCTKLRQLPPSAVNILVIIADDLLIETLDLPQTMQRLRLQAEQRDPAILDRHRYRNPADFFQHFHRLSGIVLRGTWDGETRPFTLWANPQARHPAAAPLQTALKTWPTIA